MPDFDDLQKWIELWGLPHAHDRLARRVDSELSDLQAFHEAVSPRLETIIDYLNQFPVDGIPAADQPLAWMALAICEVDDALHTWKANNLDFISDPVSWRTKSAYSDYR